jgi:hypothetical protein
VIGEGAASRGESDDGGEVTAGDESVEGVVVRGSGCVLINADREAASSLPRSD